MKYEIKNQKHNTILRTDDLESAREIIQREPGSYIHYSKDHIRNLNRMAAIGRLADSLKD